MNREKLKEAIVLQPLSTRAYNCLRLSGIENVEDLVTREKWEILCTNGLGKKTLKEIEEFLKEHGLRIGMKRKELYPPITICPHCGGEIT